MKKNNETQSRREFFKESAKKALPIIGAIAVASLSIPVSAKQSIMVVCEGCNNSCKGTCKGKCEGGCAENHCKSGCIGSCFGSCSKSNA